jgi:TPR repeat protein
MSSRNLSLSIDMDDEEEDSIDSFMNDLTNLSLEDIVQKHTKNPESPKSTDLSKSESNDEINSENIESLPTPVSESEKVDSPKKDKKSKNKNKKSKKDKKSQNKSPKSPENSAATTIPSAVSPTQIANPNLNSSPVNPMNSMNPMNPMNLMNPVMGTPNGTTISFPMMGPGLPLANGTPSPAISALPDMNLSLAQVNAQIQQLQQILIPNIVQRTQQLTQQRIAYVNQINLLQQQQPTSPENQQSTLQLYQLVNNINQQLVVNQNQFNMAQQQIRQFQQIQLNLMQNASLTSEQKSPTKAPVINERTHSMKNTTTDTSSNASKETAKSASVEAPEKVSEETPKEESKQTKPNDQETKPEESQIDYESIDLNAIAKAALAEEEQKEREKEREKENQIDYESIDLNAIAKAALAEEEEKANKKSIAESKRNSKRLSTASSKHSKILDEENDGRARSKSRNSVDSYHSSKHHSKSRSRSRSRSKTRSVHSVHSEKSSKLRNDISKEIENESSSTSTQSPVQTESTTTDKQEKVVSVPVNTNNAPPPILPKRQIFMNDVNVNGVPAQQSPQTKPVFPDRGASVPTGSTRSPQPIIPNRIIGASPVQQQQLTSQSVNLGRIQQSNDGPSPVISPRTSPLTVSSIQGSSPGQIRPMPMPMPMPMTMGMPLQPGQPGQPMPIGIPIQGPPGQVRPVPMIIPVQGPPGQVRPIPMGNTIQGQPGQPGVPGVQIVPTQPGQPSQPIPIQSPDGQSITLQSPQGQLGTPGTQQQNLAIPQPKSSTSSVSSFENDNGDIDINDTISEGMNTITFNRRPTFKKVKKTPQTTIRLGGSDIETFNKTLDAYRLNVKNASDPVLQFNYAKFLIDAANNEFQNDKEYRENLIEEGYRFLKKLSNNGYPEAQYYLANFYIDDNDWDKALPLLVQAAKHNHGPSCFEVGKYYERKHDNVKANQYYKKAASNNSTEGMYRLGVASLHGELNHRKDIKNAVKWFKRALNNQNMDEGCGKCAFEMAQLYEYGYPPAVYQDDNYALELYVQAAELNCPEAQYKLGEAFERGDLGCPVDAAQSIHWFVVSSESGEPRAQFALAGWYLTGAQGVLESNDQEAYRYCLLSANQEYEKAEYALGYFYEMGIGIEANAEESNKWYKRAADHGDQRAIDKISGNLISHRPSTNKNERKKYIEENQQDCIIA